MHCRFSFQVLQSADAPRYVPGRNCAVRDAVAPPCLCLHGNPAERLILWCFTLNADVTGCAMLSQRGSAQVSTQDREPVDVFAPARRPLPFHAFICACGSSAYERPPDRVACRFGTQRCSATTRHAATHTSPFCRGHEPNASGVVLAPGKLGAGRRATGSEVRAQNEAT